MAKDCKCCKGCGEVAKNKPQSQRGSDGRVSHRVEPAAQFLDGQPWCDAAGDKPNIWIRMGYVDPVPCPECKGAE